MKNKKIVAENVNTLCEKLPWIAVRQTCFEGSSGNYSAFFRVDPKTGKIIYLDSSNPLEGNTSTISYAYQPSNQSYEITGFSFRPDGRLENGVIPTVYATMEEYESNRKAGKMSGGIMPTEPQTIPLSRWKSGLASLVNRLVPK